MALAHEGVQFGPSLLLLSEPVRNRAHHPGDFFAGSVEEPGLWDLIVEDGVDRLGKVGSHDDFTLDGGADVVEGGAHDLHDISVPFDLELVEDVERLLEATATAHGVVEHVALLHQALLGPDHVNVEFVLLCFVGDGECVDDLFR